MEKQIYGSSGYTALRQSLSQTPESSSVYYIIDQSVALLPSAAAATKLLDQSKRQWQSCAGPLDYSIPNGTVSATLSDVQSYDDLIVQNRTVPDGETSGHECQHAMGVWSNVVAEAVVCGGTDTGGASQTIVDAILAKAQA